jgi:hypothetical protein
MKNLSLPLIMLLSALSATAYGNNLDSPARTKPTIMTELKRGSDIAFACDMHASAHIQAFSDCIDDESANQARIGTGTEAFSLGLYFTAAVHAEIYFEDGRSSEIAKAACRQFIAEVDKREKALKVTDKQLAKLAGMSDKAIQYINKARLL